MTGERGPIRYAKHGDAHLAFRMCGEGPPVIWVPSTFIPMEAMDEEPSYERFLDRLASFSTLILFDRVGIGLSDPLPADRPPTVQDWASQVVSVLDAAGVERAWVLAHAGGGMPGVTMAVDHEDRVSGLALALAATQFQLRDMTDRDVGTVLASADPANERPFDFLANLAPSKADDARFRQWFDNAGRRGASPSVARRLLDMQMRADVSHLAAEVNVPTLVLVRPGYQPPDLRLQLSWGADIPGARVAEIPGVDGLAWLDHDGLVAEVEDFVTGARGPAPMLRALRTVLFSDVVGSTTEAARLGDAAWRDLLETHDRVVRHALGRHDGTEIDTAGDGFVATFESPTSAVQCAARLHQAVGELGLRLRIGIHCGEVEVRGDDIAGMTVHIAARVQSKAEPGETLVTSTVREIMAGSGIPFVPRGEHELKGVPDRWRLYAAP